MAKWGLVLAIAVLAGCSSAEQQAEEAMRSELAKLGTVKGIDLSPAGSEDNLAGHAVVTTANGDIRLQCAARRLEGTRYDVNCAQEIDEAVITQMESIIRTELEKQVTVHEVNLRRDGDARMVGIARVTDSNGITGELNCSAVREAEGLTQFDYECLPPGR